MNKKRFSPYIRLVSICCFSSISIFELIDDDNYYLIDEVDSVINPIDSELNIPDGCRNNIESFDLTFKILNIFYFTYLIIKRMIVS